MSDAQTRALAGNILDRLDQLAGVSSASHASSVPMGYFGNGGDTVLIDGAAAPANQLTSVWGTTLCRRITSKQWASAWCAAAH